MVGIFHWLLALGLPHAWSDYFPMDTHRQYFETPIDPKAMTAQAMAYGHVLVNQVVIRDSVANVQECAIFVASDYRCGPCFSMNYRQPQQCACSPRRTVDMFSVVQHDNPCAYRPASDSDATYRLEATTAEDPQANYFWFAGPATWSEARQRCFNEEMELASIHSAAENAAASAVIQANGGLSTWIGLNDQAQAGLYTWSDGTNYDYNGWMPGEPNGNRANAVNEDCVVFLAGRSDWSDQSCVANYAYLCVIQAKQTTDLTKADCTPEMWSAPIFQPWDPLRAKPESVTVSWMPGWHPWCEVNHYHVEARQPGSFPLRFAALERLQNRELEDDGDMNQEWPGDEEWTTWKLVYSGLSRAFRFDVDTSKGHAVQFRVRACGRRIKPGFDVQIAAQVSNRQYEVVREPYLGMKMHTDRDFVVADLGWFTARRGFVYIRTPMEDKIYDSNTHFLTLNCPDECIVYLCYDYEAYYDRHWWLVPGVEGWTREWLLDPPYPRIQIYSKQFPAGYVPIRGDDDSDWAHGVPLIFVRPAREACPHPSDYSKIQTTHTILGGASDKINFYIGGMGMNSPAYAEIRINHQTVYKRRDQTGLVLAVFSRIDFSLQWLKNYDTHRNRTDSLQMSKDMRMFNETNFVFVASSIAWEWQATRTLAETMDWCGAYHFGQWVHVFAEQPHYESPKSDLQKTASQAEFGHPYVFIGIPGIGAGHGWESLQFNTGHYIPTPTVGTEKGFIRGIAYYDYVARLYRFQNFDMKITKTDFFIKNQAPLSETIHNPTPAYKKDQSLTALMPPKPYEPYVGTLRHHVTKLIEANETVPPYNYAFLLYTVAGVIRVDPRPRHKWITEYERVWSGPSARYWPHNGSLLHPGIDLHNRNCTKYLNWGYAESSPEKCGPDFDCNNNKALNDFSSKQSMINAGWNFSWDNVLTFKPDKYRYDLTGNVPWTSYWGLNNPFIGEITLNLKGQGTMSIDIGNCWQYSLGYVELLYISPVLGVHQTVVTAYSLEISKTFKRDFVHGDSILIREVEAVMVINSIDIDCWGCCKTTDVPGIIATQCNIGVTPTMCRNIEKIQIQNYSTFRVIDTDPFSLESGGMPAVTPYPVDPPAIPPKR
jgi:hypothetical protein